MIASRTYRVLALALGLCVLVLAGCSRQPEPNKTGEAGTPAASTDTRIARPAVAVGTETATPATAVSTGTTRTLASGEVVPLEDVFFAFDKAALTADQRKSLEAGSSWL